MTSELYGQRREWPADGERIAEAELSFPGDPQSKWLRVVELSRGRKVEPDRFRQWWDKCFQDWPEAVRGPAPMWFPAPEDLESANLTAWMRELAIRDLSSFHSWTIGNRAEFWSQAIRRLGIRFRTAPETTLRLTTGSEQPEWLPGAAWNIVESCFQAPPEEVAIVHQRPGGPLTERTYGELQQRVQQIAAALRAAGFRPGDSIAVVLPMTAESVAIYLGILWAGAVVVSIADSFAAPEIANRLRISSACAVLTYDMQLRAGKTIPLYQRVCEATQLPVIVLPHAAELAVTLRPQDVDWRQFLARAGADKPEPWIGQSDEAINILFSSGTTGDPKAIPWTHLTPIKCAIDGHCHQDIHPGQRVTWPTNLGWMMGPFLIFASLINRATIALYEDAPLGTGFGQFVEKARVNMLGVVPTIVKAWRASRCMEACDWSQIRVFSSTGESSQRDDMFYLSALAGMRPVIEYCGGTEIGGGFITSSVIQPNVPGAFSTPAVGNEFVILDAEGQPAEAGELFLVPPAIGLSQRLLNRDHHETYFARTPVLPAHGPLRRHGDHFQRLPGGFFVAGGRVDDTMNLGGIKISSAELERALNRTPGVRETAAVAVSAGGPEELVVFVVLDQPRDPENLRQEFNDRLKSDLNPLFRAREVHILESLPRTASNKVLRRELRARIQNSRRCGSAE